MLLRFRVSNYRSLRDEQELSMIASSLEDSQGAVLRPDGLDLGVLPVAALYGANAAGKSTVLAALEFMREAVKSSHRVWPPEGKVPLDPFLFDPLREGGASTFEVDFLFAGVRYRYGFTLDRVRVRREWLSAYPNRREQVWFLRDVEAEEPFVFGKHLKGSNKTIASLTRANSLFLSAAAENNHQSLFPVYSWFWDQLFSVQSNREMTDTLQTMKEEEKRLAIVDLVRFADLGIVDVRLKERA